MKRMHNKNEIKEVVNDGIQNGEIQANSKLYKHTLYVENDTYQFIINFLSEQSESYTIDSDIQLADIIVQYASDEMDGVSIIPAYFSFANKKLALSYLSFQDIQVYDIRNELMTSLEDSVSPF